jgi:hypothetical protein
MAYTRERYEQEHPAKAPAPAASFTYHERDRQQWLNRVNQSAHSSFVAIEDEKPRAKVGKKPKAKAVTENSPCVCGHTYASHNTVRPAYPPLKSEFSTGDASSILSPCEVSIGCGCWNFIDAETGKPAGLKRPKVMPHVLCAKCQHPRSQHCTAHRPSKAKRKPWQQEWEGFVRDGQAVACKHTTMEVFYSCNSTACAVNDGENWCSCARYVSPLTKPKLAKAASKPRKSRAAEPAAASLASGEPVRPRKSRKKKSAFVTGTPELFPAPGVEVNP